MGGLKMGLIHSALASSFIGVVSHCLSIADVKSFVAHGRKLGYSL